MLVLAHGIELHSCLCVHPLELAWNYEVEVANKMHNCHSNEIVDVFGIIYL